MPFSFYFSHLNWQSSWGLLLLLLLLLAEQSLPLPGLDHERLPIFENNYSVSINIKQEEDDMLLYIYGLRIDRAFTVVLIVSLDCKLRMKRNRGK